MNQLPKWMDLTTQERHKLLGELIDAMIYSGEAVHYLSTSVEQFRAMGWVRSVIMPDAIEQSCPECEGKGCDECVIILNNE
jgi:hypothetical protein